MYNRIAIGIKDGIAVFIQGICSANDCAIVIDAGNGINASA